MEFAAKVVQIADKCLNLLIALLFGGYSLWDTYRIYMGAKTNSDILKYKPTPVPDGSNPTLAELITLNPDVCAWLTVDDTGIDYPITQGENNMTYVNTSVFGEYSLSGNIFLDCRNAKDFSDTYSIVYGHHMDASAMFGDLECFLESDYFESHETGTLYLLDKTYKIEFFSCLSSDAYNRTVFTPIENKSANEYQSLLDYSYRNAVQYRDIGVSLQDAVIALSTCSDATTNGRTILFGRLCEIKAISQEGGFEK